MKKVLVVQTKQKNFQLTIYTMHHLCEKNCKSFLFLSAATLKIKIESTSLSNTI
jgi:hypothetical protein